MADSHLKPVDAFDRRRLRQSLLQLGGLLLLTLLTTTLLGLFSSWSLERAHLKSESMLVDFLEAVNVGRDAQVHVKQQVQEWKNILLRGGEVAARARYRSEFEAAHANVQQRLKELGERLEALGQPAPRASVDALRAAHAALLPRYQEALQGAAAAWDPFALDRAVRGIDRPINEQFDTLVETLRQAARQRFEEDQRELKSRYQTLTRALWTAMVLAVALVGVLLWRVLRVRSGT